MNNIKLNIYSSKCTVVTMNPHIHFIKVFWYEQPHRGTNVPLFRYYPNINSVHRRWWMDPPSGPINMVSSIDQRLITTIKAITNIWKMVVIGGYATLIIFITILHPLFLHHELTQKLAYTPSVFHQCLCMGVLLFFIFFHILVVKRRHFYAVGSIHFSSLPYFCL